MSTIRQLINPPNPQMDKEEQYKYNNSVHDVMNGLTYVMNPSVLLNADFSTLGSNGTTPITQADGDDAEFSNHWNVFGASNADYTLTPTSYPTGAIGANSPSLVQSASPYYVNALVTDYTAGEFYFYQRQMDTVRKYQKNDLTFGLVIYNNLSESVVMQPEIYTFYDPSSAIVTGKPVYLKAGLNKVGVTLRTPDLLGRTLGAGNYTEFRLRFLKLGAPTADLNFHQIKCEFGTVNTLLNQEI